VVLEAMSASRAVIASDIGGLPDMVIHEETGLLVRPSDADSLRDAMRRLLADEAWMAQLGEAGRQRVRQFSANVVVPQVEAVYHEVLRRRQRAGAPAAPEPPVEEPRHG
jgi:glycosyltransferase involved in cell wall biosynthesis